MADGKAPVKAASGPSVEKFVKIPVWVKARIRAATDTARAARNRTYTPHAFELYLAVRQSADFATGLTEPMTQRQIEAALGAAASRWTIARATAILRAAGVITTSEVRDKRGYVRGLRYELVFDEPRAAGLCSTEQRLAQGSDGPMLHDAEPPMLHRCTPYVAPVLQPRGSRSLALDQKHKSRNSTVAPSAPVPVADVDEKTERPPDAATNGHVQKALWTVLRSEGAPTNDPDVAAAAGDLLADWRMACPEEDIRRHLTAIRRRLGLARPRRRGRPRASLVDASARAIAPPCRVHSGDAVADAVAGDPARRAELERQLMESRRARAS